MYADYAAAEALECHLGDPLLPNGAMAFESALELDEREEYPERACAHLDGWNLHHYYVPSSLGGRLASAEELDALVKVVARRDLTVAIAHAKTLLGSLAVWVDGSPEQKNRLAKR